MKAQQARNIAMLHSENNYEKAIKQIHSQAAIGNLSIELVVPSDALLQKLKDDGYEIEQIETHKYIVRW